MLTRHEDIKKQSCHLHCQSAYSTQSGKPLYLTGVFILENLEYYKNLSLENIKYYDLEGNLCIEEWKDIPNYERIYQSSTLGRIKSLARDSNKCRVDSIRKPIMSRTGYLIVILRKNGKTKSVSCHRAVAITFIPNPKKKKCVNHLSRIKTDNSVTNLDWATHRENTTHYSLTQNTSSKYVGVSWSKLHKKWASNISLGKKFIHLGLFKTEYEAHLSYQKAVKEIDKGTFVIKERIKTSKYKGVSWDSRAKKWTIRIVRNGKTIIKGQFVNESEAHETLQYKIKELPC